VIAAAMVGFAVTIAVVIVAAIVGLAVTAALTISAAIVGFAFAKAAIAAGVLAAANAALTLADIVTACAAPGIANRATGTATEQVKPNARKSALTLAFLVVFILMILSKVKIYVC
jgi:hypothetical protein